jgi:hypothetical protein
VLVLEAQEGGPTSKLESHFPIHLEEDSLGMRGEHL